MTWANWQPIDGASAADLLARLAEGMPQYFSRAEFVTGRTTGLLFYGSHRVVELELRRPDLPIWVYLLEGDETVAILDGSSGPIHLTNEAEELALTDDTVEDYLRFFLYFLRSDGRSFVLVEPETQVTALDGEPTTEATLDTVHESTIPLTGHGRGPDGLWTFDISLSSGGTFFRASMSVSADGIVEMVDDDPIVELGMVVLPEYPVLDLTLDPALEARLPNDRAATEAIVSVLLEEAILGHESSSTGGSALFRHYFNSEAGAATPVERFVQLVRESRPVITVESDIPFVEEFVAGLLDGPDQVISDGNIGRATGVAGDELRCEITYNTSLARLHLLSFHVYDGLWAAERTANELALGDAPVIVGCDRHGDVPEPLRRINDLTLTFPRIDPSRFARIFERVFRVPPTAGWDPTDATWANDLVPADFHMPVRLGLDADAALVYLRERAETRLRLVSADVGPSLDELHGLGEARQICEDLIADIGAAQAGEIEWSAVDKGLLIDGAPGTGKTTLARALAKACGIKFIAASAPGWQSAGALDAHLRAMRADFAEARRYAPSILFLDEIDSIGSREGLDDRNGLYQTEVINALLEQIQGIETTDPIIVIGATNHADRVDPALRRAGRLDQVVHVPLPNVEALAKIFEHYLKPYRQAGQVAPDARPEDLAQLSLGTTGADVEFFVRGAFRRARQERRAEGPMITQAHLLAEVTRRSRHPESAPRLSPEAMRRVAVHEAGHALASLTSSSKGADLSFLSIVPRLDGSLGFVASVPDDDPIATRRTLIERIEIALGGRAAEELVFGSDEIGAGSGGPSPSCDLAVAAAIATAVVCQSGLGDGDSLRWTQHPSEAQDVQINALLDKAYRNVIDRLRTNLAIHERIVEVLMARQELSGHELRALLGSAT